MQVLPDRSADDQNISVNFENEFYIPLCSPFSLSSFESVASETSNNSVGCAVISARCSIKTFRSFFVTQITQKIVLCLIDELSFWKFFARILVGWKSWCKNVNREVPQPVHVSLFASSFIMWKERKNFKWKILIVKQRKKRSSASEKQVIQKVGWDLMCHAPTEEVSLWKKN